jgi:hypothetical protein
MLINPRTCDGVISFLNYDQDSAIHIDINNKFIPHAYDDQEHTWKEFNKSEVIKLSINIWIVAGLQSSLNLSISVSLWLAAFCLTKLLLCNVATLSGIPFISESSFHKCASQSSKKILCRFQIRKIRSQASVQTAQSCVRTPISVYCSSLYPSRRLSNTSRRSSEFQKNLAFKCIRQDDIAIPS